MKAKLFRASGRFTPDRPRIPTWPYSKIGTIGVLWERGTNSGYQFITFTRFNRDWLEPKEEANSPPIGK
jgi:hypothetical protein